MLSNARLFCKVSYICLGLLEIDTPSYNLNEMVFNGNSISIPILKFNV